MALIALGINHSTAPVEIRERVAIAPQAIGDALGQLVRVAGVDGAAILSTCNRTELYCKLSEEAVGRARTWLHDFKELRDGQLLPFLYEHKDEQAVQHMLRVATGLDSMVVGEPQILGQLKEAHRQAKLADALAPPLDRLFQHSFSVAKKVRTNTDIGASAVSVAYAAVTLARQIFGSLEQLTVLLVGAGETIELAAHHLHAKSVRRIVIANRTLAHAQHLATQFDAYAIDLAALPHHIHEADVVITSTGALEPVITAASVRAALKRRRNRPVFMVDIAVPRDIDPQVGDFDDVYLYTIDDLQSVIEAGMNSRREAAREAEAMIDLYVQHFMEWLKALDAVDAIRTYRDQAGHTRDQVLQKALGMLRNSEPESVMVFLAHTLTNKLLHTPCTRMREASGNEREDLLEAAQYLLDIRSEGLK